jgi:15-cis-phytoene synthase
MPAPEVGPNDASADVVAIAARAFERDRYLAALLAPRALRADLIALAAFAGEVGRIPAFVTEPMMGRIRLQWWLERIQDRTSGGHPVAAALIGAISRHKLRPESLIGLIEAHEDSLEDRPFGDEAALLHYVDRIDGTLFDLAARITGVAAPNELTRDCGRAYGLARVLLEMPATRAHGRLLLPCPTPHTEDNELLACAKNVGSLSRRHLAAIRAPLRQMPRRYRTAFLPVALVEPYLDASEMVRPQSASVVEINPMLRVWRLWRCHWTARV